MAHHPMNSIEPLTSAPRHMMLNFPFIIILACWGKRPNFSQIFLACSLPLLTVYIILFINHYWLA